LAVDYTNPETLSLQLKCLNKDKAKHLIKRKGEAINFKGKNRNISLLYDVGRSEICAGLVAWPS
jgi:hypothetical protein